MEWGGQAAPVLGPREEREAALHRTRRARQISIAQSELSDSRQDPRLKKDVATAALESSATRTVAEIDGG
jgi:hypothetical protein